jgi:hypothetical protein
VPVIPGIGAFVAGIGPDLAAILTIQGAIRATILPLLDALGAGGAGGNGKHSREHCEHEPGIGALHDLGFRVDEGSTIEWRKTSVQAWAD